MGTLDTTTAVEFNIKYYLNDKIEFSFYVYRNDVAVDLSAKVLKMQIKRRRTDDYSLAEFKTSDGTMVIGGASSNKVTCSLATNPLRSGFFVQDLQDETSEETISYGQFWAVQDVTR